MTYLNTVSGNHRFNFNGTIIIAWIVVGSETICVSLDNYEGDWLRFTNKFSKVYEAGIEGMQQFLENKIKQIEMWLPKAIAYAQDKRAVADAEKLAKEIEEKEKTAKDRSIKLYRTVSIRKGNHKINIVTQPYQVGIYIAISDTKLSGLIQSTGRNHNSTNRNINKIIKGFTEQGYKVESRKEKIDYTRI